MAAPSGKWYFDGTPGDIVEQFRDHENAKILNPFVTAFAKAVQKMPVLEYFLLETELGYDTGYWDISYHAPGSTPTGMKMKRTLRCGESIIPSEKDGCQTTSPQKLSDALGGTVVGRS
ncbi:hypothetical protein E8E13_000653 [Curvularia kusanoi]|uniref:Uncharacterized protein n=1 Tax=Curvularia kusanoi TaxID=90978 RepID=A0A9P4T9V0_CURKU|nr:hypothetical protein E8E13_000653 [Curvularia kusanoi]